MTTICNHPNGCITINKTGHTCSMCELENTLRSERERFHRAMAKMANMNGDLEHQVIRLEARLKRINGKRVTI